MGKRACSLRFRLALLQDSPRVGVKHQDSENWLIKRQVEFVENLGGTMEEQLEIAKLQAELSRMEQLAYTYHCELGVALDALKQIKEGRTTAREMIGTATWALNTLEDIKIAAADS